MKESYPCSYLAHHLLFTLSSVHKYDLKGTALCRLSNGRQLLILTLLRSESLKCFKMSTNEIEQCCMGLSLCGISCYLFLLISSSPPLKHRNLLTENMTTSLSKAVFQGSKSFSITDTTQKHLKLT